MNNEKIGPCPIPNCALEWHCAGALLCLSIFIWGVSTDGSAAHAMRFEQGGQYGWSTLLAVSGLTQLGSLLAKRDAAQRWAALLGFFVTVAMTATIVSNSFLTLPMFIALVVPLCLSEGYVYLLLRGAKWSRSLSSG